VEVTTETGKKHHAKPWLEIVDKPSSWCSLPATLQKHQVTANMQNASSAYETDARGRTGLYLA